MDARDNHSSSINGTHLPAPKMDISPQHSALPRDLRTFNILLAISQVLGAAIIVLAAVWADKFLGGLGWYSSQDQQFNYHPLFMVLGLVICYGESILVYRVLRREAKFRLKVFHATLHAVALLFTLVGLIAVFLSKEGRYSHLYSLHSWLGLGTCIAFFLQYVASFTIFLFPGGNPRIREKFLSLHTFFGLMLFAFAVGSCIVGINEKITLSKLRHLDEPGNVVANVLGLSLVLFGGVVGYLVSTRHFRRQPLSEEMSLALHPEN